MKRTRWLPGGLAVLALTFSSAAESQERPAGWLGFSWIAEEGEADAVHVDRVYPGSPAATAGMRAGDWIVRWNGNTDVEGRLEALRLQPGDTVRLRVRRGSRGRDLAVVAAQRPPRVALLQPGQGGRSFGMTPDQWQRWQSDLRQNQEEIARIFGEGTRAGAVQADSVARLWGRRFRVDSLAVHADSLHRGIQLMLRDSLGPRLQALRRQVQIVFPEGTSRTVMAVGRRSVAGAEFEEMNDGLANYFGTDQGALVLRVSPGTPAARAGLQAGDVVLQANDQAVESVQDLREALGRVQRSRDRAVELEVLRHGERHEFNLRWE